MRYGVGVDLGGTAIKIGIFTSKGDLLECWSIKTDKSNNGEKILIDIAKSVSVKLTMLGIDKSQVDGLGIGIPGAVTRGVVDKCVNLGWSTVDVEKELGTLCGLKVYADNDANVAALGEYEGGSGSQYSSILLMTLGTGVGGGLVLDGFIVQGFCGCGGEIGHITVNPNEEKSCNCGKKGCLEQYTSATGIRRLALEKLIESSEESSMRQYGEDLTAKEVFDEAKNGDKLANEVLDYSLGILARVASNICYVFNPEAVIIGGGVANAGEFLIDKMKTEFNKGNIYISKETKICLASLGEKAGIYGAFYLTKIKK